MTVSEGRARLAQPDPIIRQDLDRILAACQDELTQLSGKSLLLTGGSGFVGRYLVETMLRFNETSHGAVCSITLATRHPEVLERRYPDQINAGEVTILEWSDGDSTDLHRRRWDYLIHAAAPTDPRSLMRDPDRSLRDIISMALSTAQVAKASGSRRTVLISSGAVYGHPPDEIAEIPEEHCGGPDISRLTSVYAEGKRVSEMLFRAAGIDQRTMRVFSLIGPYQDLSSDFAVPDLIRQAANKGSIELKGDGSAVRSYCYSADLSAFLFKLLLGQPRHDVYNVGNRDGTVSIGEVAQMVSNLFGGVEIMRTPQLPGPSSATPRYVPQLDRMYEVYSPRVGVQEGLWRTCQSLYSRGLIGRKPVDA